MASWLLAVSFALLGADPSPAPETSADAVTLRDGTVVLGQVADPAPRGTLAILVRRQWAEEAVPEWARRWREAELPALRQARRQFRERLGAWRRERGAGPAGGNDPIAGWIGRELA